MKYFLVIGIEYKKYVKPANITIHVGDKFIDTFQLDRDYPSATNILPQIETQWYNKFGALHWISHADWVKKWINIPSLFKVYEIDGGALKGRMEIKVENANSDFTNGFMKNSSVIKFPIVALFKKDLVENRGEKLMRIIKKIHDATTKHMIRRDGQDYNDMMDPPLSGFVRPTWPNAESFYVSRENEIYEKSEVKGMHWSIGGSFTAKFMIETKHHMKVFAPAGDRRELGFPNQGNPGVLILATCKQLLNIYNEDQRSNRTKD
tara:strand:- start:172 stop:960 length:789 start_codon:yes stop_codon:yes gene_type:complete